MIVLVVEVGGIEPLEWRFLLASFTNSISFQPENKKYEMKYLRKLFSQNAQMYSFIRLVIFFHIPISTN